MPKAVLSNNKGLVQSSGNGLRVTAKNSNGAGLHFKTMEFSLAGYTRQANDDFVGYLAISETNQALPNQSIVLGCSAVVTELSNLTTANFSISVVTQDNLVANSNATGEIDLLATVNAGSGATLNKGFGALYDAGKAISGAGAGKVNLCVLESGSNTAGTHTQGKIVVTVMYVGVES